MMKICFSVAGQRLRRTMVPHLVRDSTNYIQLNFSFMTKDWAECEKKAIFDGEFEEPLNGDAVLLPAKQAAAAEFTVSVYGTNADGVRITTNDVTISMEKSGFVEGAIPTPESILAELERLIDESGISGETTADKFGAVIERAKTHEWLQQFFVDETTEGYPKFAYNNRIISYAPFVDLSQQTDLRNTFNNCQNLRSIPEYDCSKVLNAERFCYMCISLTEFPKMKGFCKGSKNTTLRQAFYSCYAMHTIGELDCTHVSNANTAFYRCEALEKIDIVGVLQNTSYSFQHSTKLSVESAKGIIRALANYAGTEKANTYSITFPSEVWEKLNAEGNTAPHGGTWKDYVETLAWQY